MSPVIMHLFDDVEVIMARAALPKDHPSRHEPMSPERAARQLFDAGRRVLTVGLSDRMLAIEIVRAFPSDVRFGDALNTPSAMQAVRYHLQRLCDAAQADKFDPEHIEDVRAESARFRAQTRPPEAAE